MIPTQSFLKIFTGLSLAFILFTNDICAQTGRVHRPKFSAALTGGLSIPTGNFADKENVVYTGIPADIDGGARTGWNGNLQLNARISSLIWASVSVGFASYQQDEAGLAKQLKVIYRNDNATVNPHSWNVWKILAGPSFRLPLGRKFALRPAVSAGIVKTAVPVLDYTLKAAATSYNIVLEKHKMPAAFACQVTLGSGYAINRHLSLIADFNYSGGQTTFNHKSYGAGPGGIASTDYKYDLNALSASMGVEFAF